MPARGSNYEKELRRRVRERFQNHIVRLVALGRRARELVRIHIPHAGIEHAAAVLAVKDAVACAEYLLDDEEGEAWE